MGSGRQDDGTVSEDRGGWVTFQMAEVAVSRKVFAAILARLRRWAAKARAGPVDAVT